MIWRTSCVSARLARPPASLSTTVSTPGPAVPPRTSPPQTGGGRAGNSRALPMIWRTSSVTETRDNWKPWAVSRLELLLANSTQSSPLPWAVSRTGPSVLRHEWNTCSAVSITKEDKLHSFMW